MSWHHSKHEIHLTPQGVRWDFLAPVKTAENQNLSVSLAQAVLLIIDFLGFQRIDRLPYSPDLALYDFAVFMHLKGDLHGNRMKTFMTWEWRFDLTLLHMKRGGTAICMNSGYCDIGNVYARMYFEKMWMTLLRMTSKCSVMC